LPRGFSISKMDRF